MLNYRLATYRQKKFWRNIARAYAPVRELGIHLCSGYSRFDLVTRNIEKKKTPAL